MQLLTELYNIIQETGNIPPDRQQYIDGYLTAIRALDVITHEELEEFIKKVHFDYFGMTIEERRANMKTRSGTPDDYLDIPTYIREGKKIS